LYSDQGLRFGAAFLNAGCNKKAGNTRPFFLFKAWLYSSDFTMFNRFRKSGNKIRKSLNIFWNEAGITPYSQMNTGTTVSGEQMIY